MPLERQIEAVERILVELARLEAIRHLKPGNR